MTCEEFSNQFDLLYNNIMSNQAPGLDEYEKSVFLTKAQDEILKSYFNPRLNKSMEGYDGSEKRQIDFSMIMRTDYYGKKSNTDSDDSRVTDDVLFFSGSNNKRIILHKDIMMFVNEFVDVERNGRTVRLTVVPLSYQEINRLSSKPYKRPTHYQAWRIIDGSGAANNNVELVIGPNDTFKTYIIRYIKRPYPIILESLPDGLTINGYSEPYGDYDEAHYKYIPAMRDTDNDPNTPNTQLEDNGSLLYEKSGQFYYHACELDPILHEEILQRAVELAKAAFTGDLSTQIALGVNSETNMGIVQPSSK